MISRTLQSWGSPSTELQQGNLTLILRPAGFIGNQEKSQSLYKAEVQGLERSYNLHGYINSCAGDCFDQWVETNTVAEQSPVGHLSREVKVNGPF